MPPPRDISSNNANNRGSFSPGSNNQNNRDNTYSISDATYNFQDVNFNINVSPSKVRPKGTTRRRRLKTPKTTENTSHLKERPFLDLTEVDQQLEDVSPTRRSRSPSDTQYSPLEAVPSEHSAPCAAPSGGSSVPPESPADQAQPEPNIKDPEDLKNVTSRDSPLEAGPSANAVPCAGPSGDSSVSSELRVDPAEPEQEQKDQEYQKNVNSQPSVQNPLIILKPVEKKSLPLPKTVTPFVEAYMTSKLWYNDHLIPLWIPYGFSCEQPVSTSTYGCSCEQPGSTSTLKERVRVGDVGVFTKFGSFDTSFNIFYSLTENRAKNYKPPPDFVPYDKPMDKVVEYRDIPGGTRYTDQIETTTQKDTSGVRIIFTPKKYAATYPRASALLVPNGGRSYNISPKYTGDIERHVQKHAASWYYYLNLTTTGEPLPKSQPNMAYSSLILVTETSSVPVWATVTAGQVPVRFQGDNKATLAQPDCLKDVYHWEVVDDPFIQGLGHRPESLRDGISTGKEIHSIAISGLQIINKGVRSSPNKVVKSSNASMRTIGRSIRTIRSSVHQIWESVTRRSVAGTV